MGKDGRARLGWLPATVLARGEEIQALWVSGPRGHGQDEGGPASAASPPHGITHARLFLGLWAAV